MPRDNTNKPRHSETLKFLLEHGCPPDTQDICRQTALGRAIEIPSSNVDLARMLIAHGANVNHRNIYGMAPIFQAVMTAHSKAVDVLMEYGADLDVTDADGKTVRDAYMLCGPMVLAVIRAWERRRAGEQAPVLCGMSLRPLLFIRVPEYAGHVFNTYCLLLTGRLEKDWKKHKQSCKRFSGPNAITVKPHYELEDTHHKTWVPMQRVARAASGFPSQFLETKVTSSDKQMETMEYPKKKIIKVQVPRTPGSDTYIMVYDAKRELLCYILRSDAPTAYDRLTELVLSKGAFGLKAYLVAALKSKDELVIKIEVSAEQPF